MLRYFAKHPVAANLLMMCILIAGIWAIYKLNSQFLPRFDLNYVNVQVIWPNANATDIEQAIITPIERELRNVSSLKRMISTARRGSASIVLEFKPHTDMVIATEQVKTRVNQAAPLPENSEPPIVTRIEHFEPIANVLLYGDLPFPELKKIAYQYEKELLNLGIDKVTIEGIPAEELLIQIPSKNLLAISQTLDEIGTAIRQNNPRTPIGDIGGDTNKQTIRVARHANVAEEYANILVSSTHDKHALRLQDIAVISQQAKNYEQRLFYQGMPAINLKLMRSDLGDALEAAKVLQRWQRQQQHANAALQVHVHDERWQLIQQRLNLLIKNGLTGLLFIVLVLFVFLHQRLAFWIALGIPLSLFAALAILYLAGGSINMLTLFAMIMSLGIVVDDTIVVGENALTQYHQGKTPLGAAVAAATRMAPPVIASSLTTIAAFMPLLVIGGIIGQILIVIPFMVICIIIASLFECFFILPAHLSNSMQAIPQNYTATWRQTVDRKFQLFKDWMNQWSLYFALKARLIPVLGGLGIFVLALSLFALGWLSFTFFPTPDGNRLSLSASFAAGTSTQQVKEQLMRVEQSLKVVEQQLQLNEDRNIIVMHHLVTGSTADPRQDQSQQVGERYGHINVELVDADKRHITNLEFIQLWRKNLPDLTQLESLEITSDRAGPPGEDIDIQITGLDQLALKEVATTIKTYLDKLPGVNNIKDDLPYGMPTIVVKPHWPMLTLNLSLAEIARQLHAGLSGIIVQQLQLDREKLDVVVQLPKAERENIELLDYYPIKTPTGKMQIFSDLVQSDTTRGFDEIKHDLGERSIHVTAEVDASINNSTRIIASMQQGIIKELRSQYPGLQLKFEGMAREQRETLSDMKLGAVIAMTLIYFILVMVFASYSWPFILLLILPLASSGALIGHWLMGYDVTILSLFGIFGLTGIIANDGIVLLTYCKKQLAQGAALDLALQQTLNDRFRAVFLTSITTIVGLCPLLFESSLQAQFLIPMAIAITFGLAFGFFLILFLLPTLVVFHYRLSRSLGQLKNEMAAVAPDH